MTKRLCDLVEMVENNKNCVVLAVKEGVEPLDLIRLGGFTGQESMFRMSKDPSTIGITVFNRDGSSQTMNVGSSNTIVGADLRQVRQHVTECVNLYFGVFTLGDRGTFAQSAEATLGIRDLNSPKHFELHRGGGRCSLFVNDQHVALEDVNDFESWLEDRGMSLEITATRGNVDYGLINRMEAVEVERCAKTERPFGELMDEAYDKYLVKTSGWGVDVSSVVSEFVRFAKQEYEPSLDDLMSKAKESATEKSTSRPTQDKQQKPPSQER